MKNAYTFERISNELFTILRPFLSCRFHRGHVRCQEFFDFLLCRIRPVLEEEQPGVAGTIAAYDHYGELITADLWGALLFSLRSTKTLRTIRAARDINIELIAFSRTSLHIERPV